MKRFNMWVNLRYWPVYVLVFATLLVACEPVAAYTASDATTIRDAYVRAFYAGDDRAGWFKKTQTNGVADFWEEAEEIETFIDLYEAAPRAHDKALVGNLLRGFIKQHGTNWSDNIYNDDCMWATIAFARGSQVTGNARFKEIARWNFDMVIGRAWDNSLGGGLYWTTDNRSKNACVNGPAGIAACLLGQICHEPQYEAQADKIFDWERARLFNPANGAVADCMDTNGTMHNWTSTYNQGTFIGLANFLGHTNDAGLAADYTRLHLTRRGLLPQYGVAGNNSGFNAIFLRWMIRYMRDRGLESSYLPWLQDNANAARDVRRAADGLSWDEWLRATPNGKILYSWDCISSLETLQLVPLSSAAVNSNTSITPTPQPK
jgi:predicted alpha-1,6-mannanase (GH76 family)